MSYSSFARFYDAVNRDASERIAYVRHCLARYAPAAQSVLELGCGTGLVLSQLGDIPTRVGVDNDPEMLSLARRRTDEVDWILGDVTEFALEDSYDAVLCVYDTVNHLHELGAWRRLFERAHAHLNEGGLFVFDVNTVKKLQQLGAGPPWIHDFDANVMIMDVACETDGDTASSLWDIRVFAPTDEQASTFALHTTQVREIAIPLEHILTETALLFEPLELADEQGRPATEDSRRAYFALRRR